jgi:hypothetical protein
MNKIESPAAGSMPTLRKAKRQERKVKRSRGRKRTRR